MSCSSRVISSRDRTDDDDASRPRCPHLIKPKARLKAADGEPRLAGHSRHRSQHLDPYSRPTWFRRRLPHGPDAEVVDVRIRLGSPSLLQRVGRPSEDDVGPEHRPSLPTGEIPLPDMQKIRSDEVCDISSIIDAEKLSVAVRNLPEHFQCRNLSAGFQTLVPQLDDVHSPAVSRLEKLRQITLRGACIGAQVEPGFDKLLKAGSSVSAVPSSVWWIITDHPLRVEEFAGALIGG